MNYWGEGNHQNPRGPDWPMRLYLAVCAAIVALLAFGAIREM